MRSILNLLISKAYAQDLIPCSDGTMADPSIGCVSMPSTTVSSESNIADILLSVASSFMTLISVVAIIFLMVGGIRYTLAAGDDEKIRKSKQIMLWSLIGFAISLSARTLAHFVLSAIS